MPNVREQPLRVAMVGCGCVAKYGHAPAIAASDSLTCVAYVDRDRSRAEDFARCFGGGDVYEDYRRVLDRKDVDAVAVLTMPTAHGPIVLDALRAGKHVFSEKPISSSLAVAEQMVQASRDTGRKLFVGFLLRHTGVYVKMGEIVRSGALGRPLVFRMTCFERYDPADRFYWNRAMNFMADTSPAIDCGSHYVDLMRWYSGEEAVRVQGIGGRVNPEVPAGCYDWEMYQIEFDGGSRGFYEAGWGFSFPGTHECKQAIGPKGWAGVRLGEVREGEESGAETVFCPNGGKEEVVERSPWKGFDEEWEHFARMVREDLDPYPALHDALASLRIVTSGHRSAVEGVLIDLRTDSRDINP